MTITHTYGLVTRKAEFQANGFVNGDQFGSEVISLSGGGFAVSYANAAMGNNFPLVTFYDKNFLPVATQSFVPDNAVNMQGSPDIIQLANGHVVVIWDEGATGNNDVLAAILDPNTGATVKDAFVVSGLAADTDPQAIALANGNWIVAMNDATGINLNLFTPLGAQVGISAVIDTAGKQYDPAITALKDGGYVVTYTDDAAANNEIMAQVFNGDGSVRKDAFLVGTPGDKAQSDVAGLPDGRWAVVYVDDGWSGSGLTLKVFKADGSPSSIDIRVDTNVLAIEDNPEITVLANGFIVVTWTHPYAAGDNDIHARVFTPAGDPVAIDGKLTDIIITSTATNDRDAAVAALFDGVFATTWTDSATDGSGGQISGSISEIVQTVIGDSGSNGALGTALSDIMHGMGGNDALEGLAGNDQLFGESGDDTLHGGNGNDYIDGGADKDMMYGGKGDDTYFVDDAGDKVIELDGGGVDAVITAIDFDLAGLYVEDLMLSGPGNLKAYGNKFANHLWGGDGDNHFEGRGGADSLSGGDGFDTAHYNNSAQGVVVNLTTNVNTGGDAAGDVLTKIENLEGSAFADTLTGNAGDNVLNGKGGADQMHGLVGNDTYYVDNLGDKVFEVDGQGVDTVRSSVDFSLAGQYIENLTLTGNGDIHGTGNKLDNQILGNKGDNLLDGGTAGADTMAGGEGDDIYVVNSAGDKVVEKDGEGSDHVKSSVDFSFAGIYAEKLTLTGAGNIDGTGNSLKNALVGNSGDNVLDGRQGADTLTGGGGADSFHFSTALSGGNIDVVSDFNSAADSFGLDNAIFKVSTNGSGMLDPAAFKNIATGSVDANDRILYNSSNGDLFYDQDGSGNAFAAIKFADLANHASVSAADFFIF